MITPTLGYMTPSGLARLKLDEGLRLIPYNDATGQPVYTSGNVTIGYGRNLSSQGITREGTDYLLNNNLIAMWNEIVHLMPWVELIDPVRKDVMIMVEYNTGNVFAFRKMLAAMKTEQWAIAANELMNSKAAEKLPDRYGRMKTALLNDSWA